MRGGIRLFKIFGISIYAHITFLILPLLFYVTSGVKGVALVLFVFTCVTVHELFHSVVAKRFGVAVRDITLYPIGGVASLGAYPEKPKQEFLIAIAGPAFNIIFSVALFYPLYAWLGPSVLFAPSLATWRSTIAYAFWINPMLAAFNLLPAFPMDGGRILRAFLTRRFGLRRATQIAVGLGNFFALVFGIFGILNGHLMLVVIAIFIYMAAVSEESQVNLRESIKGFYVKDVLSKNFYTVSEGATLGSVLEFMFKSHQEDFPVVENGRLAGFLTRSDIIARVHSGQTNVAVSDVMRRSFPVARPADTLAHIQRKMEEFRMKAIPVVQDGALLGVVTLEDISRVYAVMTERG